jgi:hypothetical protein
LGDWHRQEVALKGLKEEKEDINVSLIQISPTPYPPFKIHVANPSLPTFKCYQQ